MEKEIYNTDDLYVATVAPISYQKRSLCDNIHFCANEGNKIIVMKAIEQYKDIITNKKYYDFSKWEFNDLKHHLDDYFVNNIHSLNKYFDNKLDLQLTKSEISYLISIIKSPKEFNIYYNEKLISNKIDLIKNSILSISDEKLKEFYLQQLSLIADSYVEEIANKYRSNSKKDIKAKSKLADECLEQLKKLESDVRITFDVSKRTFEIKDKLNDLKKKVR